MMSSKPQSVQLPCIFHYVFATDFTTSCISKRQYSSRIATFRAPLSSFTSSPVLAPKSYSGTIGVVNTFLTFLDLFYEKFIASTYFIDPALASFFFTCVSVICAWSAALKARMARSASRGNRVVCVPTSSAGLALHPCARDRRKMVVF